MVGAAAAAPLSLIEKANRICCCARPSIVTMKKKAMESRLWAALVPNFEDLRETVMHAPVCIDCPSDLKRNGGDMARFSEETGIPCLLCAA